MRAHGAPDGESTPSGGARGRALARRRSGPGSGDGARPSRLPDRDPARRADRARPGGARRRLLDEPAWRWPAAPRTRSRCGRSGATTSRYAPACSRRGPSELAVARYFLSRAGSDGGPIRRVHAGARLLTSGMRAVVESMTTHCQVTGRFARELRFGPGVIDPLQHTFARWDGKGVPRGLSGEAIAIAARVFSVANYVEVEHRAGRARCRTRARSAIRRLDPRP